MIRTMFENGITHIGKLITKSSTSFGYFTKALPYPFHEQCDTYFENLSPILMSVMILSVTSCCLLIRSALLFYKARRHFDKTHAEMKRLNVGQNERKKGDENTMETPYPLSQLNFYEHFLKDALMLHALHVIRGIEMEDAEEYVRTHFTCIDHVRKFMVEVRMLHEQYARNTKNTKTFGQDGMQTVKNVRRSPRLNQRMTSHV